ncbi:ATP-dependent DNA helicase DinG [Gottfriedia sp. NPDC056225]|uniref:ATP-dependent DNA helicase DinG n=1 Tax=Gottfriedia sp. NPDC056225 TaxID=3345751 RepID=UPI0015586F07|nr:ATP-dependent DNA helicase DinG [Arthrobacter citreus]
MNKFVVVDLETTGNNNRGQDRIIQIAAFLLESGEVIEQFSSFINPNMAIPAFISELTGISDEMVLHAPQFEQIADELYPMFQDAYFVAHNVHFDLTFLQKEFERIGLPKISPLALDTVELTRILFPTLTSYKLSDLAKVFNIQHENPHQADSDAEVTAELLTILLKKLESLPYASLKILEKLSNSFKSDITYYISDLLQRKSESISKEASQFEEFRRIALKKRSFSLPQEEEDFVDFDEHLKRELADQMAVEIPNFTKRKEQYDYMHDLFNAFQHKNIILAEAGTGVGKTLGYLIPSAFFSKQNGKQVVISTSTIALQKQLLKKHVKTLEKIIPFQLKIASIQSKRNYLCLQKFEYVVGEQFDDNYDSILSKAMITVWLTETEHGELDELSLPSGGLHLWERVCCNDESENKRANPWFHKCFYQRAKSQLMLADLIITNHAYLLSTLKNKDHLINSVKTFVIDEAHALEETASKTFGITFSCLKYYQYLSRLSTTDSNEIVHRLYKIDEGISNREIWWKKVDHLVKEIKYESDELFRLLRDFILTKQNALDKENIRQSITLSKKNTSSQNWKVIQECANRLIHANNTLFTGCEQYLEQVDATNGSAYHRSIITEFKMIFEQLRGMKNGLYEILFDQNEQYICWMETEAKGSFHTTMLYSEKVDNADLIKQFLIEGRESIVLTSATMSIDESFAFIKSSLGIEKNNVIEKIYPVPNDFAQGMKVYIPNDLMGIKEISQEDYALQTSNTIRKIVNQVKGRTLVLFTAFDLLKQTYDHLIHDLDNLNSSVLAQGFSPGGKQKLIKQFLQSKQTILLGTNTFWEGIDLPNEELDCLIIVRLPFTNPEKPMFIAKSNLLKKSGENSFSSLALPLAVFKFRQGYGRLIRNEKDQGSLFVLDNRIINTNYGAEFLKLIPNNKIRINTIDELLKDF